MKNYLEFEKEIKSLEEEVEGLKSPFGTEGISEVDTNKIRSTQEEINEKLRTTYGNLNSWQKTQVARHPDRPYTLDYIKYMFTDFIELHGDRRFRRRSQKAIHYLGWRICTGPWLHLCWWLLQDG